MCIMLYFSVDLTTLIHYGALLYVRVFKACCTRCMIICPKLVSTLLCDADCSVPIIKLYKQTYAFVSSHLG